MSTPKSPKARARAFHRALVKLAEKWGHTGDTLPDLYLEGCKFFGETGPMVVWECGPYEWAYAITEERGRTYPGAKDAEAYNSFSLSFY